MADNTNEKDGGKKIDYDFAAHERPLFDAWKDAGYFRRGEGFGNKKSQPYTIVIPPPNITGQLHMGHALDETLQDIIIRFRRMQGYSALWLPGTDHASIATEAKIVEAINIFFIFFVGLIFKCIFILASVGFFQKRSSGSKYSSTYFPIFPKLIFLGV